MPESFLFHTASSLFGKLASHAYEEASRVYGVYKDLKRFKDTLSIVKGLLLDADEKKNQPQQHALREWLRQIQNICFEAEDVLEGFELRDKRKQVVEASGSKGMKVHDYLFSSNPLAFRIKMAYKLKKIRRKLDKVANVRTEFGLVIVDPGVVTQAREMTYPDVDASSVIGRESDKEEIMKLLMQPHLGGDGDKTFCVIPIVGIGGMGKTTLAKLVYNDNRVANHFQLKMWVSSNDFDIKQIIIKAINSETSSIFASTSVPTRSRAHQENINHLDIVQLVSRLRQKLNGKKFLLVLDDIWSDDRAKWIDLKDLLKVGAPESKIVVTTRSNSIASMMGTVPSYVLKGLLPEDCLSIFIKWSFEKGEDQTHPKLVGIGKVIVEKCQGVPLAVKTIGRSLYSDFDINRWVFVRDSEMWNLDQKKDDILPALKLSYDQMPLYLRQCFACFSLFPKDHIFDSNVMCSLWVSLGLVQSLNGSEKLENVARKYIDQLHSRSLLQDVIPFGSFCQFKVHDLIHDLALYVGQEDFVAVGSHIQNIPQQVRHLSVVESDSVDYDLFPKSKRVRSILFPIGGVGLESESVLDTWVSRYKYLRYLDLSGSSINFVPSSIGKALAFS